MTATLREHNSGSDRKPGNPLNELVQSAAGDALFLTQLLRPKWEEHVEQALDSGGGIFTAGAAHLEAMKKSSRRHPPNPQ